MKNTTHVATVESVITKENGVFVNAQDAQRPATMYKKCPLLADFSGIMAVPAVGQRVVVSKDTSGFEYIEGILSPPDGDAVQMKEKEFLLQFDTNTKFKVKQDGSGGYNISLEASGDVDVRAGGDIRVGEDGEKVAKQNHTHPTGNGDTGTPNESGTETMVR